MNLEINSRYIITDSGGLQEEACILGVLCITIRENTERLETVSVGANILVGCDKEKLINALNHKFVDKWDQPFGFGDTAKKILDIICPDSKDKNLEEKKEEITVVGLGYMGFTHRSSLVQIRL